MPTRRHDIEACLQFLTPEEGGRASSVFGGYRADFRYKGDPTDQLWMIWAAEFITEGGEPIPPQIPVSGTIYARMWIVNEELRQTIHRTRILEGVQFKVPEGTHVVAEGVVTKLAGFFDEVKPSVV